MSEDLADYYLREIERLNVDAKEFAKSLPDRIADGLGMSGDDITDPHVLTMLQSFAYLNARTRRKIDDDFSEISDALIGVLYPHYRAPIPSFSLVQFELNRTSGAGSSKGYEISKKDELESMAVEAMSCRYRPVYPVTLWPFLVADAAFGAVDVGTRSGFGVAEFKSLLRIDLTTFTGDVSFADLGFETVRFHIWGDPIHRAFALYELLFDCLVGVEISDPYDKNVPTVSLGAEALRPVGFEPDEGLLEYDERTFLGYRLLTDFFCFSRKFLFFDLAIPKEVRGRFAKNMRVTLKLNRSEPDLEPHVGADTFRLGCTPVVNLSRHSATVDFNHTQFEYKIVPNQRYPEEHEVHTVESVVGIRDGREVSYSPFFALRHDDEKERRAFWHAVRRRDREGGTATDVFLQFVDLDLTPSQADKTRLNVDVVCTNRDLPRKLGTDPGFTIEGRDLVSRINCLVKPTNPFRSPVEDKSIRWRLVNQLVTNHTPLTDPERSPKALRDLLRLCDLTGGGGRMIDGIGEVSARPDLARVDDGAIGGFCRGLQVTIDAGETGHFDDNSAYLFAVVLERFLGLYCSINSFVRIVFRLERRSGEVKTWKGKARAGERVLL